MSGLIRDTRDQPGLEVAPPVIPQDTEMEYYQPKTKDAQPYVDQLPSQPYVDQLPSTSSPRICGLRTRTFWIAFALVLVVLGAAIGGGVGGGLSAAHKDKSVSTPPQQQPTSSAFSSFSTTSTSTGIPPSSTQPGTYRIINIAANTAIDLLHGGTTNDTVIECWQWNPYDTPTDYVHQAWQIASVGNGAIIILNTQTNSYITAPSNLTAGVNPPNSAADASVYSGVPGSPTDPHTQWVIVPNSDNSVSFQSKAYPTKLLDLDGGNPGDGTLVILWEENHTLNQEWRLVPS